MKTIKNLIIVTLAIFLTSLAYAQPIKHGGVSWKFDVSLPVELIGQGNDSLIAKTSLQVYSLTKNTGKIKWQTRYKNRAGKIIRNAIVEDQNIFVIVDANPGNSTEIHLLNKKSGKRKWRQVIKAEGTAAALLKDEKNIYLAMSLTENNKLSSRIYAINKSNGKQAWAVDFNTYSLYTDNILIAQNDIYLIEEAYEKDSSSASTVIALDKSNGTVKWRYSSAGGKYNVYRGNLLLAGNILIHSIFDWQSGQGFGRSKVVGIDTSNGMTSWELDFGQEEEESKKPLLSGNLIYRMKLNQVYVIDSQSGQEKWRYVSNANISDILINGKNLYILSGKTIVVLDAQSGKKIKQLNIAGNLSDLILINKGVLYATYTSGPYGSNYGIVNAFNVRNGKEIWRLKSQWRYDSGGNNDGGIDLPSVLISRGQVYFASSIMGEDITGSGVVYAVKQ